MICGYFHWNFIAGESWAGHFRPDSAWRNVQISIAYFRNIRYDISVKESLQEVSRYAQCGSN